METATAINVLCIVVGGVGAQWVASRLRVPAIVLLFALGLLLGPVLGILHPTRDFGAGLRPIVGLAVAIVVFEGGLALDLRELREAGAGIIRLTTVAVVLSVALGTIAAHYAGGFAWPLALLYAAIVLVTGPTVILPLLRTSRLEHRTAALFKWEAIINDPIGAIGTGLILDILLSPPFDERSEMLGFVGHIALGAITSGALGVATGYLIALAFRRDLVPEILKTPALIAGALGTYVTSNLLLGEAGLIAVTTLGVTLANLRLPGLAELRRFKEALVVLIVSALFIVLTADLDPKVLGVLSGSILLLTAVMLVLVRPLVIALATLGSHHPWRERALIGWIAPRGIVAAATAGVAGLRLQEAGYAGAELVQPTVFALIAATVVLHGLTLRPLARRLHLTSGDKPVMAILGASPWAIDLAAVLARNGVAVLLVDAFGGGLRTARRLGLPVLQVELLSRHAEQALEEHPIDYFFAATPDQIYNAIVCARLAPEIGRERVYQLATTHAHMLDPETGVSRDWRGKVIAAQDLHYAELARRHDEGWRFAQMTNGQREDGHPAGEGTPVVVLKLRPDGALAFPSVDEAGPFAIGVDDRAFALVPPHRYLP